MRIKVIFFVAIVVTIGCNAIAQQLPQSNLYTFNKYNINPAYAGYNKCFELYGSHLSQWVGIDGAPSTNYFSAHSGLGKNMGIGGGIIFDKAAFISRFSGRLSYSYGINFGPEHHLRLGISAGLYQIRVDASGATVDDITDDVVSGGSQIGMTFDSEFGVFYMLKGFQLGISVPQIFETEAKMNFQQVDGFTETRHFVAYAGYDLKLKEKWSVEPSVLYKTAQSGLDQFDFNAMVTYNKLISAGVGYRTHVGFLARLGLNIKDLFYVGYAYEFPGANIASYSNGSHEIMLGLKFCKDKEEDPIAEESEEVGTEEDLKEEDVVEVVEIDLPEEVIEDEKEEDIVESIGEEEDVAAESAVSESGEVTGGKNKVDEGFKEEFNPQILFPYNNWEDYSLSANKDLSTLADYLKSHPSESVLIIGHACDLGTKEDNMFVSEQRADEVYQELLKLGVNKNQMTKKAVGESDPLVPNTSEANRAKNRRVVIEFQKK